MLEKNLTSQSRRGKKRRGEGGGARGNCGFIDLHLRIQILFMIHISILSIHIFFKKEKSITRGESSKPT